MRRRGVTMAWRRDGEVHGVTLRSSDDGRVRRLEPDERAAGGGSRPDLDGGVSRGGHGGVPMVLVQRHRCSCETKRERDRQGETRDGGREKRQRRRKREKKVAKELRHGLVWLRRLATVAFGDGRLGLDSCKKNGGGT